MLNKIKCLIWNKGIKLFYCKIYPLFGRNEFHFSLNIDVEAVVGMSQIQKDKYFDNLMKRRKIMHEKTINKEF